MSLFSKNMIIAATGQLALGLEDTRVSSLALLYFLRYKPKLTLHRRA